METYREAELCRLSDEHPIGQLFSVAEAEAKRCRLPYDPGQLLVRAARSHADEAEIVVSLRIPFTEQELQEQRDKEQRRLAAVARLNESSERGMLASLLRKYPEQERRAYTVDERLKICRVMRTYGGSFAYSLAEAWLVADSGNGRSIEIAFWDVLDKYSRMAAEE